MRALAAVVLLALAAPPGLAQAHEHGAASGVAIAHDVPPDGRTFVGTPNHFAVVAHGDDAVPDFHQDVPWRVSLDGVVLAEATVDSGHDYDGVNAFDVVFPAPGEYLVEALGADGKAVASFGGTVEPLPDGAPEAAFELSVSPSGPVLAGQPVTFTYTLSGAREGTEPAPLDHSDAWFEVWAEGGLAFRAKTHTHGEAQEAAYAFPEAGDYTVRLTGYQAYPSAKAALFAPVVHEAAVSVLPGPPANAGLAPPLPPPPAALNAAVTAPAGGMLLVGTFDPYTAVGPATLQHLDVLAVDPATGQPFQHVDFTAVLDGPAGQVFRSETLHEYDGILEFTARQPLPGPYTLRVTAEGPAGSGEIAMTYTVLPPAVPLNAGPVAVALDAPATAARTPAPWTLTAAAATGPFAHGELEVRLRAAGQPVPLLQAKLHTHEDGRFPLTVALPEAGAYVLDVTPFPLMPEAVLPVAGSFPVQATEGSALPLASDEAASVQEAPAAPTGLLLAGLAALAALATRRR